MSKIAHGRFTVREKENGWNGVRVQGVYKKGGRSWRGKRKKGVYKAIGIEPTYCFAIPNADSWSRDDGGGGPLARKPR